MCNFAAEINPIYVMYRIRRILYVCALMLLPLQMSAQYFLGDDEEEREKNAHIKIDIEAQASMSKGKTPLWLNANKYGLSSLKGFNGYVRASAIHEMKPYDSDEEKPFDYAYGVDLAAAYGYTSTVIIQQAYGEVRWLRGKLTVGSKNWKMELKDNELSSGSQTLGKNARPVPQVRLALDEYWSIPGTKGIVNLKGHIAYGMLTDQNWQKDFTNQQSKYVEKGLYHSKAGFLKIGNAMQPLSLTLGVEMATMFGGTSYIPNADGTTTVIKNESNLKAFWNAFLPTSGGGEVVETTYQNVAGNMLGSWVARLEYKNDYWSLAAYLDHFFEDHSGMFFLDYNGYGTGEEWQQKKERKYFLYKFKDMMVGFEYKKKLGSAVDAFVFETIYSKYQSGPIYHDHTSTIPDHICGNDNYYNHYILTPWQHWGQVIGNPLYQSPIYNDDGVNEVRDNRFFALHLGVGGHPTDNISYRFLATYQDALGTYSKPYEEGYRKNVSLMAEATYEFPKHWQVTGAIGMDRGNVLGNNFGGQITVRKTFYK